MLDDPEKTSRLLTELKRAVPFKVMLTPEVVLHLRGKQVAAAVKAEQTVADFSYAGDEGGIVCHLAALEGGGRTFRVADPRSSAAVHEVCRVRVAVPEASRKEVEEAGPTVEGPLPLFLFRWLRQSG